MRIPTYTAEKTIGGGGQRNSAGMLSSAGSVSAPTTGKAVTRMGQQIAEVNDYFRKAEILRESNNLLVQARTHLADTTAQIQQDKSSFNTWSNQYDKEVGTYRKKLKKTTDPAVFAVIEPTIDDMFVRGHISMSGESRKAQVDVGRADFSNNLKQRRLLYEKATTQQEKDMLMGETMMSITDSFNAGYITAQEATASRESFQYDALKIDYWNKAKAMGFDDGVKWLNVPENTPDLKEEDRRAMATSLHREGGLKLAMDKEHLAQVQKKAGDDLFAALVNNSLTEPMIAASPLGSPEKRAFLKALDNRTKAGAGLKNSDPAKYKEMRLQAANGALDPLDVLSEMNKTLSKADANFLYKEASKGKDPQYEVINRLYNQATTFAKNAFKEDYVNVLLTSGQDITTLNPELLIGGGQAARMNYFIAGLDQALEKGEKSGVSREKMLNPNSKEYIVDSMIQTYRETSTGDLRSLNYSPAGIPKRGKNESIDDYLKRTGQQ